MNATLPQLRERLGLAAIAVLVTQACVADDRPNIIIMMADDMGYSDIGCYGGEIRTPSLDHLANNGLRFTQFYNTGRCCPTRAALLTGIYQHQAGIGHMMEDRQLIGYQGDLNDNCVTIAQVLDSAGYATYMSGKWHVTKKIGPDLNVGDQKNWPRQRGFDRFFGTIHGAGSFFDPNSLARNNILIAPASDDFYYTDAIADNAAQFIAEHDSRKPFFLYVAFTSPHWPMHAKPEDIQRYKGRYDGGWDALRAERYQRMIEMGLIDSHWKMTPRDKNAPPWEEVEDKAWNAARMEVYAAMIDCMDQGIGRIVNQLKRRDYLDNTLILFLADNGGCAEELGTGRKSPPGPKQSLPAEAPMQPGELQTRMIPLKTRDGVPVRKGRGTPPGPADTYIAYGLEWANASNTPFRRYKHWVHEGGISTPLIAHWPRGVDARLKGKFDSQPGHLIDLMATCVDVARTNYPTQHNGHDITPLQGSSLRPAMSGQLINRVHPIYWEHEGNRAMRDGKWKLVAKGSTGQWELYDIEKDRTELNDLVATHPQRAMNMADRWEAWAKDAQVKPWPWDKKN